ncbi:DUF6036 family nucleotidyltransferase [Thermoflexus sp.]|uniref:DUF6036 family nucleotidyltransferase n=1 Tax=Thermoflexus sp. TaxID=1969742 RepID=UPI00260842D6|nr:DUF6036 family nucleotidyltransferase [Thermoflexus sp.]MCX7689867.1 nucleotidyltransferase [Thermoflexus sp.]MDW8065688.1 DUF6036 family nucleotidyltransferase [Anaerolineae bacterium]
MGRDEILRTLRRLASRLHERGIQGDLYLVGGAAMAVAYNARRATRDIDAIFEPKMEIYQAAREIAEELGLPENWLNDAVKGFIGMGKPDPHPIPVFDEPGLRVMAASPRYLLAMKLLAARREDEEDIRFLLSLLDIRRPEEALQTLMEVYPEARIPPRARFLIEELLGPAEAEPS